ncbi:MAG: hypothetical protein H6741_24740 [Alphaproteobacteria bacterium]|nr:hypothetical protein [Alphaproteobacteria bacterium]
MLVDGDSAWIADSGCKGGADCDRGMGLVRVALPEDPQPQELDGAWTSANSAQVIGELELLGGPWYEGERLIYSVEAMP